MYMDKIIILKYIVFIYSKLQIHKISIVFRYFYHIFFLIFTI